MFKIFNDMKPDYLRDLIEFHSTGCNLKDYKNALLVPKPPTDGVLVIMTQFCGMSYHKMYEHYALINQSKREIDNHFFL